MIVGIADPLGVVLLEPRWIPLVPEDAISHVLRASLIVVELTLQRRRTWRWSATPGKEDQKDKRSLHSQILALALQQPHIYTRFVTPDYLEDEDWPTTAQGCLYELVTVGGAVVVTGVSASGLAVLLLWLCGIWG